MRRRIFWIFFALLGFVLLVPVSLSSYGDWQVFVNGQLVTVRITSLPRSKSGLMKFELDGRVYDKKIGSNSAFSVGESITLKYMKGFEGHCLFPNENPIPSSILVILFILGLIIVCFYYAFKKNPPAVEAFGKKIA